MKKLVLEISFLKHTKNIELNEDPVIFTNGIDLGDVDIITCFGKLMPAELKAANLVSQGHGLICHGTAKGWIYSDLGSEKGSVILDASGNKIHTCTHENQYTLAVGNSIVLGGVWTLKVLAMD